MHYIFQQCCCPLAQEVDVAKDRACSFSTLAGWMSDGDYQKCPVFGVVAFDKG